MLINIIMISTLNYIPDQAALQVYVEAYCQQESPMFVAAMHAILLAERWLITLDFVMGHLYD